MGPINTWQLKGLDDCPSKKRQLKRSISKLSIKEKRREKMGFNLRITSERIGSFPVIIRPNAATLDKGLASLILSRKELAFLRKTIPMFSTLGLPITERNIRIGDETALNEAIEAGDFKRAQSLLDEPSKRTTLEVDESSTRHGGQVNFPDFNSRGLKYVTFGKLLEVIGLNTNAVNLDTATINEMIEHISALPHKSVAFHHFHVFESDEQ
jgi:hypothetical protein